MSQADRIRDFVQKHYIERARSAGKKQVTVRAGDVHKEMGLAQAMPSVCGALGSHKFADGAGVRLIGREGPANGANVYLTFAFEGRGEGNHRKPAPTRIAAGKKPRGKATASAGPGGIDFSDAVALVSCVKSKRTEAAPARDLYVSPWFRMARGLIEANGAPWFILSALHGLVAPNQVIEPYERTLNKAGVSERRAWKAKVLDALGPKMRGRRRVVMFAGLRYREFLVAPLESRGFAVVVPMEGLALGEQLSWLSAQK